MKYKQWYDSIIQRARVRELTGYYETHHIVPKSLGGADEDSNLVKLTAREHFICHLLLTKIITGTDNSKMIFALWMMSTMETSHQERYKITSRQYNSFKVKMANEVSKRCKGVSWGQHTEESKSKMSIAKKGRPGPKKSDETRLKISNAHLGRKQSEETKLKISLSKTGIKRKPHSEETKKLMAENQKKSKESRSQKSKERWADPEFRMMLLAKQKIGREKKKATEVAPFDEISNQA